MGMAWIVMVMGHSGFPRLKCYIITFVPAHNRANVAAADRQAALTTSLAHEQRTY
jgi:hypothetical protein